MTSRPPAVARTLTAVPGGGGSANRSRPVQTCGEPGEVGRHVSDGRPRGGRLHDHCSPLHRRLTKSNQTAAAAARPAAA